MVSGLSRSYTKTFVGKNLERCKIIPIKSRSFMLDFRARLCSKAQNFFSSRQPYIVKK